MRTASAIVSVDGPLNLLNAIRTAVSVEARGKGVLTASTTRFATPATSPRPTPTASRRSGLPKLGVLGLRRTLKSATFYLFVDQATHLCAPSSTSAMLAELPKVDIVYLYIQPSLAVARALVADGVRGIVFAGTGAGLLSTAEREALTPFLGGPIETRPVLVRSNRTGNGRGVIAQEQRKRWNDSSRHVDI